MAAVEEGTVAVVDGSGVVSVVDRALDGAGGFTSFGAVKVEGGSGVGAGAAKAGAGVDTAGVWVVAGAAGSGITGRLVRSTSGSLVGGSFIGGEAGTED